MISSKSVLIFPNKVCERVPKHETQRRTSLGHKRAQQNLTYMQLKGKAKQQT